MSENIKKNKLVKVPKRFVDFWNNHKELMPNVIFDPIKPGFVDVARAWNCFAQMMPEMCEDVIIWGEGLDPIAERNPFRGQTNNAFKEKATTKKKAVTKEKDDNIAQTGNRARA